MGMCLSLFVSIDDRKGRTRARICIKRCSSLHVQLVDEIVSYKALTDANEVDVVLMID